jgi:hypothetical protein
MVTVALLIAFSAGLSALLTFISIELAAAGMAVCLVALIDQFFYGSRRK